MSPQLFPVDVRATSIHSTVNAPVMTAEKKKHRKSGSASDPVIPDKLYFRIGEVARICRLPAYVLRFWETEFPLLKPVKSSTGQRMYRQRDVENVLRIKRLLYEQGFTIAGARQHLRDEAKPAKLQSGLPFARKGPPDSLKKVRQGLQEILGILSKKKR
jgi:DNA-binding transcriptional MerR regulator